MTTAGRGEAQAQANLLVLRAMGVTWVVFFLGLGHRDRHNFFVTKGEQLAARCKNDNEREHGAEGSRRRQRNANDTLSFSPGCSKQR